MRGFDILKLGVLLLGVSALIVTMLAVHAYYRTLQYSSAQENFLAYCSFNTIVVHANDELKDVKIFRSNGTLVCEIEEIPRGSDEVCNVDSDGVYLVQVGNLKRAVTCSRPPYPPEGRD